MGWTEFLGSPYRRDATRPKHKQFAHSMMKVKRVMDAVPYLMTHPKARAHLSARVKRVGGAVVERQFGTKDRIGTPVLTQGEKRYGRFASAAYITEDKRTDIEGWKYKSMTSGEKHTVWTNGKREIFSFRGTADLEDAYHDTELGMLTHHTHPRFKNAAKLVRAAMEAYPEVTEWNVDGHSLGASFATYSQLDPWV